MTFIELKLSKEISVMKKITIFWVIVSALYACQKEDQKSDSSLPTSLQFVVPGSGADCEGDCNTPVVFDGCYMFEYSDTISLVRLNGLIGGRDVDRACYPDVGPFASGFRHAKISEYVHIAGEETSFSQDEMFFAGFCDGDGSAANWVGDQLMLVAMSGEGENKYVTNCIPVQERGDFSTPDMGRFQVDLPSEIVDLRSYLERYYNDYNVLCPPKQYEQDEQQVFFEKMLECSTYQPFPSEGESDPCEGTRSEEERDACEEALGE
jgi:hypothetical protein